MGCYALYDKILINHALHFHIWLKIYYMKKYICQKNFLGDHFAEKETKRGPILAKGLLRRPRSPKGDLFGNTGNAYDPPL